jgi:tetraacyldisaccharide 4'-kinase
MARRLRDTPVLVGRARIDPARAAVELFDAHVIILDDGFQHLRIERDLDIVLVNGCEDFMFPAGNLREPLGALKRSGIVVWTGAAPQPPKKISSRIGAAPVFGFRALPLSLRSPWEDKTLDPEALRGATVVLMSGIAHPDRFRKTVESLGMRVARHFAFPDHHVCEPRELTEVVQAGRALGPVITTEKDEVKFSPGFSEPNFFVLDIAMRSPNERECLEAILSRIESRS